MRKPGAKEPSAAELRRLAEERLRTKQASAPRGEVPQDQERLNHELEMQNEELRRVRDELEVSEQLTTALHQRFSSSGEADFADRVPSAMRFAFGGHLEKK